MKFVLVILLLSLLPPIVQGQNLYDEVMKPPKSIFIQLPQKHKIEPQLTLVAKSLPLEEIQNIGIRYLVQNISNDPGLGSFEDNRAVSILLNYAKSEKTRAALEFTKKYALQTAEKEESLKRLSKYIENDSIRFKNDNIDDPYINDYQLLLEHIRNDETYDWLVKVSRDSTLLNLYSLKNDTLQFWTKTGKDQYFRFWATNKAGEKIGTWINILPDENGILFYVDEGVYQARQVDPKPRKQHVVIDNPIEDWYFNLNRMPRPEIKRRYWTYYSEVDVNLAQGTLANWASGGENSLSLQSNFRYFWNYKRNNTTWENWVHYQYGFLKSGEEEVRKNADRFELNSKLGQKAFKHWFYTVQFNTQTQLFNSYQYPKDKERVLVANFMSPGYFNLSLGLDYKPNDNLSIIISPLAGRWNFVRDTANIDPTRYGVEKGKRAKRESGAEININSKYSNLFDFMDIRNEARFFMSYDKDDQIVDKGKDTERKKKPYTASWKLSIDFNINYFMKASIYTETVFDENFSKKLQFKENLNLGLKFRF